MFWLFNYVVAILQFFRLVNEPVKNTKLFLYDENT